MPYVVIKEHLNAMPGRPADIITVYGTFDSLDDASRYGQRVAQQNPEQYRDLIVRVAGYSDYFCDLTRALQNEIITRTEHESF